MPRETGRAATKNAARATAQLIAAMMPSSPTDGSGQTRLTSNPAEDDFPAWSPNGASIAFRSVRDGNPELRRELCLVFKESLHNVVKHADCARVEIEIGTAGGLLSLIVCDDGKGFEREREVEGHGLASMARRAERLGGSLRVERSSAGGTSVTLEIPLGRRRR